MKDDNNIYPSLDHDEVSVTKALGLDTEEIKDVAKEFDNLYSSGAYSVSEIIIMLWKQLKKQELGTEGNPTFYELKLVFLGMVVQATLSDNKIGDIKTLLSAIENMKRKNKDGEDLTQPGNDGN